jgi:DNA-binding MarR family transcriptional regulator
MGGNEAQSTGLRHIARLEEEGLVHRFTPPDDQRLVLVDFTPKGFRLMREYISNTATRFTMPMPD